MVVGLRIDGAAEKFDELLEEVEIPLETGDVIVLLHRRHHRSHEHLEAISSASHA